MTYKRVVVGALFASVKAVGEKIVCRVGSLTEKTLLMIKAMMFNK